MEQKFGTIEMEKTELFFTLDELGAGQIEARSDQQERLEEFTERLSSGEFHVATDATLPSGCVDGRLGASLKPNTAGGTETAMVADDLTNQNFAANDGSTFGAYRNILEYFKKTSRPIGGHTAEHVMTGSGCGANDKLPEIYKYIATNGDKLRQLAQALGIEIDDAQHENIIANARKRDEFSDSSQLLDELRDYAGHGWAELDELQGTHNEVVTVINLRPGTTLDRKVLAAEFGENYMAFNADAWAFRDLASAISTTPDSGEVQAKTLATCYYNLATAGALSGPNMRVAVLD